MNYEYVTNTNKFTVTDEDYYKTLCNRLNTDGYKITFNTFAESNKILHSFGSHGCIYYVKPPSVLLKSRHDNGENFYTNDGQMINWDNINKYKAVYDKNNNIVFDELNCELSMDEFIKELQTILPDGEMFIMKEIGHLCLTHLCANAYIVTNKKYEYVDFDEVILNTTNCKYLNN